MELVIPGKTVERIIDLGFSMVSSPTLISTWQKKGKAFVFLDCICTGKASTNMIQRVVGMTSKQIFPRPEVTDSFEQAWKRRGNKITVKYGHLDDSEKKTGFEGFLTMNSRFVPPDFIVVYVEEASDTANRRHPAEELTELVVMVLIVNLFNKHPLIRRKNGPDNSGPA